MPAVSREVAVDHPDNQATVDLHHERHDVSDRDDVADERLVEVGADLCEINFPKTPPPVDLRIGAPDTVDEYLDTSRVISDASGEACHVQSIAHPEGELAVARAAAAVGLTMTLSTVSSFTLEEVAGRGAAPKWFQLYWPRSRELAASLVGRAERAGYEAIVLTVDTFLPGWKTRDLKARLGTHLDGIGIANYTSDPVFRVAARQSRPRTIRRRRSASSCSSSPTLS